MENPPFDQPPASATEPTSPALASSSLEPDPKTEPTDKRVLLFLLGLALGLLSILLAQGISIITLGEIPGYVIPFLGLFIAIPPAIAARTTRFLWVGLLVGFLFAVPISAVLWFDLICPPGSGGGC